ncbi:CTP synthase [Candidatus Jorgensenbacteria bacterium RIFCSPLOWO2_12_FULL_42_11]|uniref:CTP synthase n=1 Tax=Candidatus Jorgensenbacteria bacterium RIFCSPLOWO2_12_FULL_42_11 TaxID=1798473 RepID=A0A1F6C2S6_9BACT|nr:MAG: CTP synthase [Candidatus Jorgensenbacteria bacterium RIFCSPLOWO2_12_FULL_42_11]
MKYIFVVGGVMSGVGKGVAVSSVAKILQSRGFRVTAIKIDPYLNVDAGTMNPTEHGEVFVLNDGTECDQDLGNYERFLNQDLPGLNYMTAGSIFQAVIAKERNLEYGGRCVEVVPHIPLEALEKIKKAGLDNKAEIVIVEIGGTVGEYQNILFLEAVRILKIKKPNDVLLVLVSFLPLQNLDSELKTKPTQYAVKTLNSAGLQPDIILARAATPLDKKRKEKIAFNCSLREEDIVSAPDVESIYEVPVNFEKDNLSDRILKKLKMRPRKSNMAEWRRLIRAIKNTPRPVNIGIVGKYFATGKFILTDSYISVIEAVKHAAFHFKRQPVIKWIEAEEFADKPNQLKQLSGYDGIIVPGGFGQRGTEGKIAAIGYCRKNKIPFLGLCYGMQLAVVEFSRSIVGFKEANSTEIYPKTPYPVIDILPEQKKNLKEKKYGATMRLGAYPAVLKKGTLAFRAYGKSSISERHRHRYEVNPDYVGQLEGKGIIFSGSSPDNRLMEIMELAQSVHPFFAATQFHPEFKSRPLNPHPLFREFIKAAIKNRES